MTASRFRLWQSKIEGLHLNSKLPFSHISLSSLSLISISLSLSTSGLNVALKCSVCFHLICLNPSYVYRSVIEEQHREHSSFHTVVHKDRSGVPNLRMTRVAHSPNLLFRLYNQHFIPMPTKGDTQHTHAAQLSSAQLTEIPETVEGKDQSHCAGF